MTTEQPTPDTIKAVAEVLKLASYMDDNVAGADKNRIMAWATQVQRHRLEAQDLLAGFQAFYDGPHDRAITVGDLIHESRKARAERNQREGDELRDRRAEDIHDAKAAEDVQELLAESLSSRAATNKTPRLVEAERVLYDDTATFNRKTAMAALREVFAARAEARKLAS